jgi:NAD(P)-dependent dehydrogenase (short-subunit alcohol dehydrogenase family)
MATDFDLSGRVAIITVGNGGIGLGMARALARAGCTVSIWGRNARKNGEALRAPRFTDQVSHDMPSFFPWWRERRHE